MASQVEKTNKKNKKTFLKIALFLIGAALIIGGGYLFTGSLIVARNAIAIVLLSGAGAGMGAVSKAIVHKIKNSKKSTKSRQRLRVKTQELENIPEIVETKENSKEAGIVFEDPALTVSKKETKNSRR